MDDKGKNKTLKKEQYQTTLLVDAVDVRKSTEHTPFKYLGKWDFIVVFLAVFLRFLVSTNIKQYKIETVKGEKFDYKLYFDSKHLIRWLIHLISAILGIIILPEVFILYVYKKYNIGLTDFPLLGSVIVGFVGYDLIRITEKIFLAILSKTVGYKPDEKND